MGNTKKRKPKAKVKAKVKSKPNPKSKKTKKTKKFICYEPDCLKKGVSYAGQSGLFYHNCRHHSHKPKVRKRTKSNIKTVQDKNTVSNKLVRTVTPDTIIDLFNIDLVDFNIERLKFLDNFSSWYDVESDNN